MRKPAPADLLFICGEACISAGVFQWSIPAGLVVTGVLMMYTAIGMSKPEAK